MTDTHIAKLMWDAYAIQAGGKTFDGKPLPTWGELGAERQACIERLEVALYDVLQYVSRADWHYLKDRVDWHYPKDKTRKALEEKDEQHHHTTESTHSFDDTKG